MNITRLNLKSQIAISSVIFGQKHIHLLKSADVLDHFLRTLLRIF